MSLDNIIQQHVVTTYEAKTEQHVIGLKAMTAETERLKQSTKDLKLAAEIKKLGDEVAKSSNKFQGFGDSVNNMMKSMANQKAMDLAKSGLSGVAGELQKIAGIKVDGSFAALGYQVAGPWGAAIGAAGELIGAFADKYVSAETRIRGARADAYLKTMREETELIALEEQFRAAMLATRKAAEELDPTVGGMNRALAENSHLYTDAKNAVVSYGLALTQLQQDRGNGKFIDRQEIELTRSLRDAKVELAGSTSVYGRVGAEARLHTLRLNDAVADTRGAFKAGELSVKEYTDKMVELGVWTKKTKQDLSDVALLLSGPFSKKKLGTEQKAFERYENSLLEIKAQQETAERGMTSHTDFSQAQSSDFAMPDLKGLSGAGSDSFGKDQHNAFLERTFGKVEEFDIYKTAFTELTGAVSSSFDAWLSGSMSAGQAVKKFLADSLKALAVQGAVESLKWIATGVGHLANPLTAAMAPGDFLAAAKWGLVAVAAGAGAVSLGSQGGGASGGGARPSAPQTGGGGGGGQTQAGPIIVYGDSFADDSPHMRSVKARQFLQRAGIGNQAGDDS